MQAFGRLSSPIPANLNVKLTLEALHPRTTVKSDEEKRASEGKLRSHRNPDTLQAIALGKGVSQGEAHQPHGTQIDGGWLPGIARSHADTIGYDARCKERLGNWTIMDVGSHNNNAHTPPTYSAYERLSLGWLTPEDLDATPRNIVLENVTTGHALRIPTQRGADEYFLLENRQQTGWDTYLPGHGMLVWHITYDADLWQSNKVNATPWLQGVDLVEADGSAAWHRCLLA